MFDEDTEDQLDLSGFRKTKDFGDFQILTDSPVKPVQDRYSKPFKQKLNFWKASVLNETFSALRLN